MSFPASLTTRTVKGRFVTHPNGEPANGFVRIVLNDFMQGPSDDLFIAPFDRVFQLVDGAFSTLLPATNDPDWTSSFYRVSVTIYTRLRSDRYPGNPDTAKTEKFRLDVPYDSTDAIDLVDVINLPPVTPGEAYVLLATRGQANGVASLDETGKVPSSQLPPGSGGGGSDGPVAWTDVTDKPSTFAPSAHTHPTSDVNGLDTALTSKASTTDLSTGLASKANTVHTHTTSQVSGLDTALDSKANSSDLTTGLAGKADTAHTHVTSQVAGLDTALASKANTTDVTTGLAAKADTTALTTGLASKSDTNHTHAFSAITGKPATYPHDPVDWTEITNKPTSYPGAGDGGGGVVDWVNIVDKPSVFPHDEVTFDQVTGKPSTYPSAPPAFSDVTGKPTTYPAAPPAFSDVTGKPSTYPPSAHTHVTSEVTGLDTALAAKADEAYTASRLGDKANNVEMFNALALKAPLDSPAFTGTVTGVSAAAVGLGNVTNTSDANKPVSTAQQTALDAKAPLASPAFTGTPTGITKTHVGLGSVDNTSDVAKPVSTAQQTALNLKAPLASPTFSGTVSGVTAAMVGLGNVTNTADSAKPVSTAQQTALDAKANLASPTFSGTVSGVTKAMVGLPNVDNTADTAKPVSTAQQTALDLKAPLASPTLTGTPVAPTPTAGDNTTKIATTAFVAAAVTAGGGGSPAWSAITAKPDYVVDHNAPLQRWYAALSNRHYAPAKIAVIGASLSEGIGASAFGRGWPPMLLRLLRQRFPVDGISGGQGWVAPWDNPGYGGGSPSYTYPVGQNSGSFSQTQGWAMKSNTLVSTGDQMNYTFTGTLVQLWYIKQTTGGTFSVTIDGVVVQASVVTAGTLGPAQWTSSPLTAGSHTILVTRIAGGGAGTVLFNGFRIFNGDEGAGIQMFNGGQSGMTTGQFLTNATNGDSWAPWLGVIIPQLVILELGLNDWAQNVPMATVKSNLKALVTTIRAQSVVDPSIVILAATEANYDPSYTQTYQSLHDVWTQVVAEDAKLTLWDMATRIPSPVNDTTDGYYYDSLHPSDKGYAAIADRLVSFLSPL